jgi:hypothetical protein
MPHRIKLFKISARPVPQRNRQIKCPFEDGRLKMPLATVFALQLRFSYLTFLDPSVNYDNLLLLIEQESDFILH